jgi:hypothetical protein
VRLDIGKGMDAFVGADRDGRQLRERCQSGKSGAIQRLLEEEEHRFLRRLDIALHGRGREPAIGVGSQRYGRPQRIAHGVRCGDVLRGLGARLGDVLLDGRIAEQPHGATEARSAPPLGIEATAFRLSGRRGLVKGWDSVAK